MANKKINELDSRSSLSLSDLMAVGDPSTGYLYKTTISDLKTLTGAGVISFNGRFGSVVPVEGDYALTQLSDVIITTAANGDIIKYNGSNWVNVPMYSGTIAQYVDGTGAYQTFPTLLSSDRLVTEVRNSSGATMTKGTVVYLNGSSGTLPTIAKAQANAESTSTGTYGVVQNDISNNANGYVVVIGNLAGLDTSAYTAGDILWLSPTVAGGFTTTKPVAPDNAVYVGIVTRSSNTQGTIEVKIQNGYELDELHNVLITSVANNDGLFYESATSLWKNKSISTVLGYTPANAATYVPNSRTITINGTTYDLSADRTWTISTHDAVTIGTANGLSLSGQALSLALSSTSATGALSSTDWNTFNGKQAALSGTGFVKISGTTISYDNSTYATTDTNQTISGVKIFTSAIYASGTVILPTAGTASQTKLENISTVGVVNFGANSLGFNSNDNLHISSNSKGYAVLAFNNTGTGYTYTLPATSGTIALTSQIPTVSGVYLPLAGGTMTGTLNGTAASFTNADYAQITYTNSSTSNDLQIGAGSSNANLFSKGGFDFRANYPTNTSTNLFISSAGNVGINTTSISFGAGTGLAISSATRSNLSLTDGTNALNIFQDGTSAYFNMYSSGDIIFRNTTGNTERLRLTNAGKVGIGISSPVTKLDVYADLSGWGATFYNAFSSSVQTFLSHGGGYGIAVDSAANTSGVYLLKLASGNGTDRGTNVRFQVNADGNVGIGTSSPASKLEVQDGYLNIYHDNGANGAGYALQFLTNGGGAKNSVGYIGVFNVGSARSAHMVFQTANGAAPIDRMIINSAGGVQIKNIDVSNVGVHVQSPNSYNSNGFTHSCLSTASVSFYHFVGQSGNGSSVTTNDILIYGNGNVVNANNSYGAISDIKLKENIIDATPKLDDLLKVKIRNYNLIGNQAKQIGVIAQELEEIFPSMIEVGKDDFKNVKYSIFVPMLIKAMQEQQAQIEDLKAKIK